MNKIASFNITQQALALSLLAACSTTFAAAPGGTPAAATALSDYREPSATVTALLTAPTPPEPLLHARSGQVAQLFREPVMSMGRLAAGQD